MRSNQDHRFVYRCLSLDKFAVLVVVCQLLAPFAGVPALADTSSSNLENVDDLTELSLEELMNIEVTTASKKEQTIAEAPASVTVITREDIRRYGYRNLAEALLRVAGLYVDNDLSYQYVGIRGFARPGDYNSRVLVLIDGHKLNDPVYDYAAIGEDFPIDIESIERIEVVKGPGSSLWGTNAVLGVINVITRKGADIDGIRLTGEVGSHSRAKGFMELGKQFANGLDIAASFTGLDSDGRNHIYFDEYDDPATNNGVAEDIDGTEAMRGYVSAYYEGLRFMFVKNQRDREFPTAPYFTVFNESGTGAVSGTTFTELSYEHPLFERVNGNLFVRVYHDWAEYVADFVYDYGYGEPPLPVNKDKGDSRSWGTEIRYSMDLGPRVSLTTGAEYVDAYDLNLENYDDDPWYWPYLDLDGSFDLASLYVQADFELLDNLLLVAGVRHDDYSTFGDHQSPRVALIFNPIDSSTLKLLYGQAFRAPDFFELDYAWPGSNYANPDLEPEEIETWELVWEQRIGNHTRVVANLFHFEMDDIIEKVPVEPTMSQFQNKGTVKSRGAELMVESRFKNDTTGYMGVTVQDAVDEDDYERLTNSPAVIAAAGVSVPVWDDKFYVTPEILYIDERKTMGGDKTDSAFMANVTVSTGSMFDMFDVSLGVYNLFDDDFSIPSADGNTHFQDTIPQDGRTFRLQVSCEF